MGIQIYPADAKTSTSVAITNDREMRVISSPIPLLLPVDLSVQQKYFDRKLDTVGDGTGTTDMTVDGSVTEQNFYIKADNTRDIYINSIVIVGLDGSIGISNKFMAEPVLANGILAELTQGGTPITLTPGAVRTLDLIEASQGHYELITGAGDDIFIGIITFPFPIRIARTTTDQFKAIIRDDLTGITELYVRAIGYTLEE